MKKRHVFTGTVLTDYGFVHITGDVARDKDYDPHTEGIAGSPFDVYNLKVHAKDEDWKDIVDELEPFEIEKCYEVLIEKFLEDEGFERDRLIDEAIERTRSFRHLAYS